MAVLKIKDKDGNWVAIPSISAIANISKLENVLQDILKAIEEGGTTSNTVAEIEQIIVSYLENKTVEEVEA